MMQEHSNTGRISAKFVVVIGTVKPASGSKIGTGVFNAQKNKVDTFSSTVVSCYTYSTTPSHMHSSYSFFFLSLPPFGKLAVPSLIEKEPSNNYLQISFSPVYIRMPSFIWILCA